MVKHGARCCGDLAVNFGRPLQHRSSPSICRRRTEEWALALLEVSLRQSYRGSPLVAQDDEPAPLRATRCSLTAANSNHSFISFAAPPVAAFFQLPRQSERVQLTDANFAPGHGGPQRAMVSTSQHLQASHPVSDRAIHAVVEERT